jgi:hypothetical protein
MWSGSAIAPRRPPDLCGCRPAYSAPVRLLWHVPDIRSLGMADWPADQIPHPSRDPPYPHQHHANGTAPPAGLAMNEGDVLRNAGTCALSWVLVPSSPKGDAIRLLNFRGDMFWVDAPLVPVLAPRPPSSLAHRWLLVPAHSQVRDAFVIHNKTHHLAAMVS